MGAHAVTVVGVDPNEDNGGVFVLAAVTASQITLVVVLVGVAASVVGAVFVLSKQQSLGTNLGLFSVANDELRDQNDDLRKEVDKLKTTLVENDKECAQRLSKMEGRLEALTDGLGEQIAARAVAAIKEAMQP